MLNVGPVCRESFLNVQSSGRVMHRLAIFDAHGAINNVVSQLDIIKCVCVKRGRRVGSVVAGRGKGEGGKGGEWG